ncbi:hypothetical protein EIN_463510 [Entamoeba invadens IP1]|uniref:Uncharacterized protein n=1 Tax=Entamoeba invadens IP1 TaxID=370355 RepID=L7FLA2_ENTIV|nr:hypothetical protein EIN_463510 [Entamoeba invadens IP1]ELP87058.1 hypothetical protein EIN_463510 [Entamoeba invadens IP1]|eukprot:XP_004253829.1 hypothetical protein EIN_463510 [Entamoeba invadens IP1]
MEENDKLILLIPELTNHEQIIDDFETESSDISQTYDFENTENDEIDGTNIKSYKLLNEFLRRIHPIVRKSNMTFSRMFIGNICRFGADVRYWPEDTFSVFFDRNRLQSVINSFLRVKEIDRNIVKSAELVTKARRFLYKLQTADMVIIPSIDEKWCDGLFEDKAKCEKAREWSFINDMRLLSSVCMYGAGVCHLYLNDEVLNTTLTVQFNLDTTSEKVAFMARRLALLGDKL